MAAHELITLLLICLSIEIIPAYSNGMQHMTDMGGMGMTPPPSLPAIPKDPSSRCEEIRIPMCRGIGYNMTSFPNEMNHETQDEAGLEVHQFWPLVEINCSPDLKFFLCSMYTPICLEDYHKPLPVCRSVCERARTGCAPIMEQYSFQWPERMACEHLPFHGDMENLCMEHPSYTEDSQTPTPTNSKKNKPKCKGKNQKNCQNPQGERTKECTCSCRSPLILLGKENHWYNTTVGKVSLLTY